MTSKYFDVSNQNYNLICANYIIESKMYPIDAIAKCFMTREEYNSNITYDSKVLLPTTGRSFVSRYSQNEDAKYRPSWFDPDHKYSVVAIQDAEIRKRAGLSDELHDMLVIMEHFGFKSNHYYACRDRYIQTNNICSLRMMYIYDWTDYILTGLVRHNRPIYGIMPMLYVRYLREISDLDPNIMCREHYENLDMFHMKTSP